MLVAREEGTLLSVALGDMKPPVQSLLLRNTGPGTMAFRLVQNALTALTEANYGFQVTHLASAILIIRSIADKVTHVPASEWTCLGPTLERLNGLISEAALIFVMG